MANERNEYRVVQKGFTVKIDRKVVITFVVLWVLSLTLLSVKLITHQECYIIDLIVKPVDETIKRPMNQYLTDESIFFSANTKYGKNYVWDFGDGSPKIRSQSTTHFYHKPGIYQVKVLVNGHCDEYQEISVLSASLKDDELKNAIKNNKPYIDGPSTIQVNQPASFSDPTNSMSWEWTVLGATIAPQTGQTAVFSFPVPGEKIILLKTNNDINRTTQKTIFVTPSTAPVAINASPQMPMPSMPPRPLQTGPPPSNKSPDFNMPVQETPPKFPEAPVAQKPDVKYLYDSDFKDIIEDIAFGSATPDDLLPKLCKGKETKFYVNGNLSNWNQVFDLIKGKSIKLEVHRDFKNKNCVNVFKITF